MKRIFWLLIAAAISVALPNGLIAQGFNPAAASAARDDAEDRYKRLNSAFEDLQASQLTMQKRLSAVTEELNRLREENGKNSMRHAATQEEIKHLADKIIELDKKREADKKLILDKLRDLGESLKSAAAPPPPSHPDKPTPTIPDTGYEYIVQPGDNLSKILKAYRDNGIKVSMQQVTDANPGVNLKVLQKGQKIFIPQPKAP